MKNFALLRRKGTRKPRKFGHYPVEFGSARPLWELRTGYIKHEITRRDIYSGVYEKTAYRLAEFRRHNQARLAELRRELLRRKNVEYRGFINQIIHFPENLYTHYLTFADWLEEQGRYLESRRIKQYVGSTQI